ncbi:1418_t:CDS:10 [Diversispora eburnea]|uniref:ubiquitinyl hydrolase 1 n=1 Tax=Diversispora eburnea TaxID=1213867 RepID=A0A9N9C996_9GLOM|nr:1418_t:CDS:10 [Diversispora eburnea]
MSLLKWMGMAPSGKTSANEAWGSGSEKYFGLENHSYFKTSFSINYYFSSVIPDNKVNGDSNSTSVQGMEDTLFSALKDLFWKINSQKKRQGVLAPNHFIAKIKKENELFRSTQHQDAHEFLNYVLNAIAENVMEQQKKLEKQLREQEQQCDISVKSPTQSNGEENGNSADENSLKGSETTSSTNTTNTTWVHQLFEGTLTNETKCLTCETVTSRDESFLDLSIDIEPNSSVTSCLRQFSASEMLCHKNKFFCDVCCGLQEAEKRMKIKKLPNVLALHLKRFKYHEKLQRNVKLAYRVVFPFELRLFNTCDDTEDPDRLYELYAICVHIGSGPYHGHYVTLVKSMGQWLLFDDDSVESVDESEIQKYFGEPGSGSGYVLFYQACDLDLSSLDPSFSEMIKQLSPVRKKDNNSDSRRKSHVDPDNNNSKDNDENQNNTHEKQSSNEKEKSQEKERSWFASRSSKKEKKAAEKEEKKKEEKKKEKKSKSENKKIEKEKLASINSNGANGIKTGTLDYVVYDLQKEESGKFG